MDARILRTVTFVAALVPTCAWGANYRTQNFLISAPTPEFAKLVGDEAERFRKELAIDWLGYELPAWSQPCPIRVEVGATLGAGGATTFSFDRGQVSGWDMSIQGPADRVVDAVLPHEVTHTIFATHFRRPLPRWADEGACTTVEHESEKAKQQKMLIEFLHTDRGISFSRMFAMKEYPRDVMPLYSQGFSLARFLIQQGGRRKFVSYLGDGMETENWIGVTKHHYGFDNLRHLQDSWLEWVRQGSPQLPAEGRVETGVELAAASEAAPPARQSAGNAEPEVQYLSAAAPGAAATPNRSVSAEKSRPAPYTRGPIYRAQNADPTPEEAERLAAQWPGNAAPRGAESGSRTDRYEPESAGTSSLATAPLEKVDSSGWRQSGPARTASSVAPAEKTAPPASNPAPAERLASAEVPLEEEDMTEVLLEWSKPSVAARPTSGGYSPGSTAVRPAAATGVAIPKMPQRPTVVDAPTGATFRR